MPTRHARIRLGLNLALIVGGLALVGLASRQQFVAMTVRRVDRQARRLDQMAAESVRDRARLTGMAEVSVRERRESAAKIRALEARVQALEQRP